MAALPYIQLYVADYLADTMHLTTEEHGAYLLLIFNYWQTGKALPKSRLSRIAKMTNERWTDVENAISEFFYDDGETWAHERIEHDLEIARSRKRNRYIDVDIIGRPSANDWQAIRERIFERDDFTCQYCGERGGNLECDHIMPIARGGDSSDENLATACRSCNRSKGAKTVTEWRTH